MCFVVFVFVLSFASLVCIGRAAPLSFELDVTDHEERAKATRLFLTQMLETAMRSPIDTIVSPVKLPRRELPPGKVTDLYDLYEARCHGTYVLRQFLGLLPRFEDSFYQCL